MYERACGLLCHYKPSACGGVKRVVGAPVWYLSSPEHALKAWHYVLWQSALLIFPALQGSMQRGDCQRGELVCGPGCAGPWGAVAAMHARISCMQSMWTICAPATMLGCLATGFGIPISATTVLCAVGSLAVQLSRMAGVSIAFTWVRPTFFDTQGRCSSAPGNRWVPRGTEEQGGVPQANWKEIWAVRVSRLCVVAVHSYKRWRSSGTG